MYVFKIQFIEFLLRTHFSVQKFFFFHPLKGPIDSMCVYKAPCDHMPPVFKQVSSRISRSCDLMLGAWHLPIHNLHTNKVLYATDSHPQPFNVPILPLLTLAKLLEGDGVEDACFYMKSLSMHTSQVRNDPEMSALLSILSWPNTYFDVFLFKQVQF